MRRKQLKKIKIHFWKEKTQKEIDPRIFGVCVCVHVLYTGIFVKCIYAQNLEKDDVLFCILLDSVFPWKCSKAVHHQSWAIPSASLPKSAGVTGTHIFLYG